MVPTPTSYFEYAKETNAIARSLLREYLPPNKGSIKGVQGKLSLGLSLQAGELVGKGMLRLLGFSVEQIRKQHARHNLQTLLEHVQNELTTRLEPELSKFSNFLEWAPVIEGVQFGTSIKSYLTLHFSKGPASWPRSYFYPDLPEFSSPQPFHALLVMIDHLIQVAEQMATIVPTGDA